MNDNAVEPWNPFAVNTPEDISASDVAELFVDVFSDFHNIPEIGHSFLHGPRGSGKSMMFRYLEPDCQQAKLSVSLPNLPFYAVYVPIKNTDLKLTEFGRLENKHANFVLNEHFLTTYIGARVFISLLKRANIPENQEYSASIRKYFEDTFQRLIRKSGWLDYKPECRPEASVKECCGLMLAAFDEMCSDVGRYLKDLSFRKSALEYSGPLCGYLDFLLPLLRNLRTLPFMPKGPIYLLLDDADNLNEAQTRIVNSWVFCRTSSEVSLKISTQLNYKTYRTVTDQRIDCPHDYSETNISSVYASSKSRYYERVSEIVKKRLKKAGVDRNPEEFFPEYESQEKQISAIAERYMKDWQTSGRGHRARDDAYRYARPDFMKSLAGTKKASSKYRYAGFEQLVYVSSGIIRFFLDPASKMYVNVYSGNAGRIVEFVDSRIQDQVIRDEADRFMFSEFDKLSTDEKEDKDPARLTKVERLRNLIVALGGAFRAILLSEASERRVFSVAFSDSPDQDVLDVFRLGVQYGYFHESSIGNKEGTGRTKMFVLSRRLAPFFGLDPTGFAGYKFVTTASIRDAMSRPRVFVDSLSKSLEQVFEDPPQLGLFEDRTQ